MLDDLASLRKVGGASRVTGLDKSLLASGGREIELERSIGSEEDVETLAERVGQVLGEVRCRARSEGVGVGVVLDLVLGDGGVGLVGVELLLVLVEPCA